MVHPREIAMSAPPDDETTWPDLSYAALRETCETLQLWTQVVGKVRLGRTPWLDPSRQTPVYVTARGLGTGFIPHGAHALGLEFDFADQVLQVRSDAAATAVPLRPMSVAEFYEAGMAALTG